MDKAQVIKELKAIMDAFKEERGAYPVCIEEAIRLLEMSYDDDVISRQALLEQIEIDSGDEPGYYVDNWKFIDTIKNMSPAQPEIVRCKGCKHQVKEWRTDKRLKDKGYMVCGCEVVGDACGFWALLGQDDDYCSYAERRTDES